MGRIRPIAFGKSRRGRRLQAAWKFHQAMGEISIESVKASFLTPVSSRSEHGSFRHFRAERNRLGGTRMRPENGFRK